MRSDGEKGEWGKVEESKAISEPSKAGAVLGMRQRTIADALVFDFVTASAPRVLLRDIVQPLEESLPAINGENGR